MNSLRLLTESINEISSLYESSEYRWGEALVQFETEASTVGKLMNHFVVVATNLFLLIEAIGITASVEFLDEAQIGEVLGLGRSCLGIFFCQGS